MRKVDVLNRKQVYKGFNLVEVLEIQSEEQDGKMGEPVKREIVERGDATAVLIRHTEENAFIFARQLRPPLLRHNEPWLTEIVAGVIDEGETPEQSARREIEEELGFRAEDLRPLGEMYGSPGGLSEKVYLYYAEVSEKNRVAAGGGTDKGEDVEEIKIPVEETYGKLDAGEFRDAKTQIALLRFRAADGPNA